MNPTSGFPIDTSNESHGGGALVCPQCGEERVSTRIVRQKFKYGLGKEAVELTAALPVRTCEACGFEFLDHIAEQRKHNVVCEHLGVLSPDQVRAIRSARASSRAEFARVSGLGEATVARWERGALIQNTSNDRYLRILSNPSVYEMARRIADGEPVMTPRISQVTHVKARFRALPDPSTARQRQMGFRICK